MNTERETRKYSQLATGVETEQLGNSQTSKVTRKLEIKGRTNTKLDYNLSNKIYKLFEIVNTLVRIKELAESMMANQAIIIESSACSFQLNRV